MLTTLPLDDSATATARARAFADVGATRLVHAGGRYPDTAACTYAMERLVACRATLGRV